MIDAIKTKHPHYDIADICAAFGSSRSGYYAHQNKAARPRAIADKLLAATILDRFQISRHTYGTPRLRADLADLGHRISRRRIARLMRAKGLQAKQKRRFRPQTTDSNHGRKVAPNRLLTPQSPGANPTINPLRERWQPTGPDEVWTTDITYIPTCEGWLYLACEMDLGSRKILGWETSATMDKTLVISALQHAMATRHGRLTGIIHHSDQGSQYVSNDFIKILHQTGLEQSMSRRGNCYDNAAMESFWATLKTECFDREIPATRAQARSMIFDYIETFYNPIRKHTSLGNRSPLQFERHFKNSHHPKTPLKNELFAVHFFGTGSGFAAQDDARTS